MATSKNLQSRIEKARSVLPSATYRNGLGKNEKSIKVQSASDTSQYYSVNVRTSQAVLNLDKNTKIKHATYHNRCEKVNLDHSECQGNARSNTVCYHCMAAVMLLAQKAGKVITITDDLLTALSIRNMGGSLVQIKNRDGGYVWGVVKDKPVSRVSLADLTRDPEGFEGID